MDIRYSDIFTTLSCFCTVGDRFFVWLLAMLRIRFEFADVLKLNNLDYKSMLSAAACRIIRAPVDVTRLSPLTSRRAPGSRGGVRAAAGGYLEHDRCVCGGEDAVRVEVATFDIRLDEFFVTTHLHSQME